MWHQVIQLKAVSPGWGRRRFMRGGEKETHGHVEQMSCSWTKDRTTNTYILTHLQDRHQVMDMEKVHVHTHINSHLFTPQTNPSDLDHKCTQEHIHRDNTMRQEWHICAWGLWACTHNLYTQENRTKSNRKWCSPCSQTYMFSCINQCSQRKDSSSWRPYSSLKIHRQLWPIWSADWAYEPWKNENKHMIPCLKATGSTCITLRESSYLQTLP